MTGTWHGDELARSLADARTAARRRWTYLAAFAAGAGWALVVPGGRMLGAAIALAALAGAAAETALVVLRRDAADRAADQLIDEGFPVRGRGDTVAGSVQRRIERLTAPQWRRQLAASLRWHLEQERLREAGRTPRPRPVPPIRGLLAHERMVCEIAAMLERPGADPRACMLVTRILTSPPGLPATPQDPRGRCHLASLLARIHTMLAAAGDHRADGYSHVWRQGDHAA
jgi:hypothetical protein